MSGICLRVAPVILCGFLAFASHAQASFQNAEESCFPEAWESAPLETDVPTAEDHRLSSILTVRAADPRGTKLTEIKKTQFIMTLMPLILAVNERVLADREFLLRVRDCLAQDIALDDESRERIATMAEEYESDSDDGDIEDLLRRVDVIPLSMIVAQAALESGWGSSLYATSMNALFGEYEYVRPKSGQTAGGKVPAKRPRLKAFETKEAAVESYVRNLNSHWAYEGFRAKRAQMRDALGTLDGYILASSITRYSERGNAYIKLVRQVMDHSSLRMLDVMLAEMPPVEGGEDEADQRGALTPVSSAPF